MSSGFFGDDLVNFKTSYRQILFFGKQSTRPPPNPKAGSKTVFRLSFFRSQSAINPAMGCGVKNWANFFRCSKETFRTYSDSMPPNWFIVRIVLECPTILMR